MSTSGEKSDRGSVPIPRFRPRRKPGEWKKDPYTFRQYGAIKKIVEAGLMPDSEVRQIVIDIETGTMSKGDAAVILDKYFPLFKELKRQEAEGCTITDPQKIQEIQDELLAQDTKKKEKAAKRRERGSCIKSLD